MYFAVSKVGLCAVKTKRQPRLFSGSSLYSVGENHIFPKEQRRPVIDLHPGKHTLQKITEPKKKRKKYKLKKTKIRNKIMNFFSLRSSKKFCAFYSISFPLAIPDQLAYSLLNLWLTRCRRDQQLKTYLWVAERQKNNTLHFHLITNNPMDIKAVNGYMKTALINACIKGKFAYNMEKLLKYNGVDVDNLYYPKKGRKRTRKHSRPEATKKLTMYLTKYISKNDTLSDRLPWHCSRDISALFISINYTDIETCELAQLVADNPEAVFTFNNEYFTMHFFRFTPDEKHFVLLEQANNLIYDNLHGNPLRREGDRNYLN